MQYRQLGNSGLNVSVIGLGANQFGKQVDQATAEMLIAGAIDLGINLIDVADLDGQGRAEEMLGMVLRGKWEKLIVATKVASPPSRNPNERGASRYHILNSVEASLRRLQSDHIDLYQIHCWDEKTPIEETLRALDDLVHSGMVRYIGASHYAAWQLARANVLADLRNWTPFVSIQSHYHMLERGQERELIPCCNAHNVGILPSCPMAGGFLTGKYQRSKVGGSRNESSAYVQPYLTEANYAKVGALTTWATERGHTMTELAHAWLLAQPRVSSVIADVTELSQVQENAKAADWQLTLDELAAVNATLEAR